MPDVVFFMTVQTAQIRINSISDHCHKLYKFIMNRRHCEPGRGRLHGKGPLSVDKVLHYENLKFVGRRHSQDDESSQVDIVLRSFSIDI